MYEKSSLSPLSFDIVGGITQKVTPAVTNAYYKTSNFVYDPYNAAKIISGAEIVNDIFNPSMPPSTKTGYIYFLYDNLKNNVGSTYQAIAK